MKPRNTAGKTGVISDLIAKVDSLAPKINPLKGEFFSDIITSTFDHSHSDAITAPDTVTIVDMLYGCVSGNALFLSVETRVTLYSNDLDRLQIVASTESNDYPELYLLDYEYRFRIEVDLGDIELILVTFSGAPAPVPNYNGTILEVTNWFYPGRFYSVVDKGRSDEEAFWTTVGGSISILYSEP